MEGFTEFEQELNVFVSKMLGQRQDPFLNKFN